MQCTVLTLSSAGSSHGEVRPRDALRYTAASRRQRTRGAPPPAGRFQKARCACRVALGPHGGVDGTRRVAASGPTGPTAPSAAGHPGTTSDCHEAPGLQLLLAFRQVACTPTWILPALRRRRFNLQNRNFYRQPGRGLCMVRRHGDHRRRSTIIMPQGRSRTH